MKLPPALIRVLVLIFVVGLILLSLGKGKSVYASNSTTLKYTVLGDSISISGSPNYPQIYSNYLNTDLQVPTIVTNLAIYGWSSFTLLDHLKNDQAYINSVKNAHIVTIMIGTNDYSIGRYWYLTGNGPFGHYACGGSNNQNCLRNLENGFRDNFTSIIATTKSLNPNAVILVSDIYNAYIAQDMVDGNQAVFQPFFNTINNYIHSIAGANNIPVANVYLAFNGASGLEDPIAKGYLISDNTHPNDQGNQVIANQFRNLNSTLLEKDFDGDGFNNGLEKRMGTDMLASCPTAGATIDNAWPLDVSNLDSLGRVTVADIIATVNKYGTSDPRYDFDGSGKVTISDIIFVKDHYFQSCPQ